MTWTTIWCKAHGAMEQLDIDVDSWLLQSHAANAYFRRQTIKLCVRGKDQHAWYIERGGALCRDQIHRTVEQLRT